MSSTYRPGYKWGEYRLGFRDVLYFRLKGSLEAEGMQLNRADRRNVYAVLSTKKHSAGSWERKGLKLTRAGDVSQCR